MRSRLLHKDDLQEFCRWAEGQGYELLPSNGGNPWEAARLRKIDPAGDLPLIFLYRNNRPTRRDFLTSFDEGTELVRQFLAQQGKSNA